jgi:hypothetical protein
MALFLLYFFYRTGSDLFAPLVELREKPIAILRASFR